MGNPSAPAPWQSEDATVIRVGRHILSSNRVVFWVMFGLMTAAAVAAGLAAHGTVWDILVPVFGLLAFLWLFALWGLWLSRDERFVVDGTGWWWLEGGDPGGGPLGGAAFLPWDALAGVALYSTGDAAGTPAATLELFPRVRPEREQVLLRKTVRDGDPPAPGLPRLRYRIDVNHGTNLLPEVAEACRRWVPAELWLGTVWQPAGYRGKPDRARYRRRRGEPADGIPSDPW